MSDVEQSGTVQPSPLSPYLVDSDSRADAADIRPRGPSRAHADNRTAVVAPRTGWVHDTDAGPEPVATGGEFSEGEAPRQAGLDSVIRTYEAKVDDIKTAGEKSIVARVGGRSIDRHRSIIEPTGIDLSHYRKSPIILWEHGRSVNRGTLPVARCQWIKCDGDKLVAKAVFREKDPFAMDLFDAYADGFLNGWSINVLAHDASPPTPDELRSAPDLARQCDVIYRRTELCEFSCVAIPSHREAVSMLISRGIIPPGDTPAEPDLRLPGLRTTANVPLALASEPRTTTDSLGGMQGGGGTVRPAAAGGDDEDEEDEADDPDAEEAGPAKEPVPRATDQSRFIRKRKGRFVVLSESGKLLGTHDTRAGAEEQLAAIEAHKHDREGERSGPGPRPVHDPDDGPVRHDGRGGWTVDGLDGIPFESEAVARRAAAAMREPARSIGSVVRDLDAEAERRNATILDDVKAYLDLKFDGRV